MFQDQNKNNLSAGNQNQETRANTISPPSLSLPKGGGAIRGIGEKFAANPVTGTASMTVPIFTSPGRSGFAPLKNDGITVKTPPILEYKK